MHHFSLKAGSCSLGVVVVIVTIALATLTRSAVADLKSDLREFLALVPRRRIGYIAARHYIVNPQFRAALQYIRSADFATNWRRIRNTTEFGDIVAHVSHSGATYDITRIIDRIPQRLRSFSIPSSVPVSLMIERNLSTFLDDAVQALPRARIADLMARKVQEGGEFADFYEAVSSRKFRQLVQKARKSRSLTAPLQKLNQNSIDVDNVITIGFNVLNWGP